jgi:hypothetical protein
MSHAHVCAWEAHPMAWYPVAGQWYAVYRCIRCPARQERPVSGPGALPVEVVPA